jgi:hypothetical protein
MKDSEADRKTLNSKVIDGNNVNMPRPENTRFATFYNAKRCGINIDVFRSYLEKHHTECTPDNISKVIVIRCLSHLNIWKYSSRSVLRQWLRAVEANILIRFYYLVSASSVHGLSSPLLWYSTFVDPTWLKENDTQNSVIIPKRERAASL